MRVKIVRVELMKSSLEGTGVVLCGGRKEEKPARSSK